MVLVIATLLIATILLWSYKFTWAAKFLGRLKREDPDFYQRYCAGMLKTPDLKLWELTVQAHYLKIASPDLKSEFMEYSHRRTKSQVLPLFLLPIFFLVVVAYLIAVGKI